MKWRSVSSVICDRKVSLKFKGKFYPTATRPAILYGIECWTIKSQQENKLHVTEMRMFHWTSCHTRQDRIKNEFIREKVGVELFIEEMVESRLSCFLISIWQLHYPQQFSPMSYLFYLTGKKMFVFFCSCIK